MPGVKIVFSTRTKVMSLTFLTPLPKSLVTNRHSKDHAWGILTSPGITLKTPHNYNPGFSVNDFNRVRSVCRLYRLEVVCESLP